MKSFRALALLTLPALAACGSDRDITLRSFQNSSGGPEEFAVLPGKPLEQPRSYNELPTPTPGGSNRTDLTPNADAVAALGGRPGALQPTGIPGSEGGLVTYASRKGNDPAIRQTLAQEDESFRRRQSFLTKIRLFQVDRYYQAYKGQSLDSQRVAAQWRNAGAPTPTAPPPSR